MSTGKWGDYIKREMFDQGTGGIVGPRVVVHGYLDGGGSGGAGIWHMPAGPLVGSLAFVPCAGNDPADGVAGIEAELVFGWLREEMYAAGWARPDSATAVFGTEYRVHLPRLPTGTTGALFQQPADSNITVRDKWHDIEHLAYIDAMQQQRRVVGQLEAQLCTAHHAMAEQAEEIRRLRSMLDMPDFRGTVVAWNSEKGSGFIRVEGTGRDVFVHWRGVCTGTHLEPSKDCRGFTGRREGLRIGALVEFSITQSRHVSNRGKDVAVHVKVVASNAGATSSTGDASSAGAEAVAEEVVLLADPAGTGDSDWVCSHRPGDGREECGNSNKVTVYCCDLCGAPWQ